MSNITIIGRPPCSLVFKAANISIRQIHKSSINANSFQTKYEIISKCPKPSTDTGCTFCEIPEFPKDKQLDRQRPLLNSKANLWKHVIVLSGDPDNKNWPRSFEMAPGYPSPESKSGSDIISEIQRYKRKIIDSYHPVLVSMTSLEEPIMSELSEDGDEKSEQSKELEETVIQDEQDQDKLSESELSKDKITLVALYPEGLIVEVPQSLIEEFMIAYLRPLDKENPEIAKLQNKLKDSFNSYPIEADLILTCGHYKRDIRCGELAPLINSEFKSVLKEKGLLLDDNDLLVDQDLQKVKVGYISHIGGHVYAGNVLIFKKNGDVIWYGRVLPKHVQGIVKETVIEDKIIKELYRGEL